MKSDYIYCVAQDVRTREEAFGLLIVSKTTPALALNEDMKAVWELINGKNSYGKIVSLLQAQYPDTDISSKIKEVFDILLKLELIRRVTEV